MAEKETEKKKGDLFSSIGSLVGLIAGGPVGGLLGGVGGALLGGSSFDSAIKSGIGSIMPMMFAGKAGGIGSLLSVMGGGMGPQARGAGLMNMFTGGQPNPMSMISGMAGPTGGATRATQGILSFFDDPILSSILMEELNQQRRPRFENVMSPMELRQYQTGERRPDYRGTPVMAAQGGYIEGPGTGTSDSIPAAIYQNGGRVQEAALSDGEFVMTEAAVRGAGNGNRDAGAAKMYQMMDQFERMA